MCMRKCTPSADNTVFKPVDATIPATQCKGAFLEYPSADAANQKGSTCTFHFLAYAFNGLRIIGGEKK